MSRLGYSVGRNKPYAGGFITEHYGNPASGLARDPARAQPRDLYGRAAAGEGTALCAGRRRFRRARRRACRPFRSAISARSRPRRNETGRAFALVLVEIAGLLHCSRRGRRRTSSSLALKKKGPLAMSKRPKSREETPKEGSDSARRYRTATICDRAAQSARVFYNLSHAISAGLAIVQQFQDVKYL